MLLAFLDDARRSICSGPEHVAMQSPFNSNVGQKSAQVMITVSSEIQNVSYNLLYSTFPSKKWGADKAMPLQSNQKYMQPSCIY